MPGLSLFLLQPLKPNASRGYEALLASLARSWGSREGSASTLTCRTASWQIQAPMPIALSPRGIRTFKSI